MTDRLAEESTDSQVGAVVPTASEPQENPWFGIALRCVSYTAAVGVLVCLVGAVLAGVPGLVSSLTAMIVVVVFFAISLLVAAYMGHRAPKAIMGAFMLTYVVKVIGFGALLLIPHDPSWFSRLWMTIGAVVSVIVWQVIEVLLFSRMRLQIFDEEATA